MGLRRIIGESCLWRYIWPVAVLAALDCAAASLANSPFPTNPKSTDECVSVSERNGAAIQKWWSQSTREADHNLKMGSTQWSKEYGRVSSEGTKLFGDNSKGLNDCAARAKKWKKEQDALKKQKDDELRKAGRLPQSSDSAAQASGGPSIQSAGAGSGGSANWQTREGARKQQEAALQRKAEQILSSVADEDQRHRELDKVTAELSRLYQQRKNDPRPGEGSVAASGSEQALSSRDETDLLKFPKVAMQSALKAGQNDLDSGIKSASKYLSGDRLNAYVVEARDTKAVLGGLGKMVSHSDYAILAANAVKAETDVQRNEAVGETGLTFVADISKYGVKEVVPRMFGPKVAAALLGPAAWAGSIGLDVLSSEKIGYDDSEIIRDSSGRFSLNQKQEALTRMWRGYDRFGYAWGDGQKTELLMMSNIVYRQSR